MHALPEAAFGFALTGPTSGAGIFAGFHGSSTWVTTDGQKAIPVKRVDWQIVFVCIRLELFPVPMRERVDARAFSRFEEFD